MTLEEALRDAARKGITHLTLYPVPSADNKTTYWCARATPSTGHSYVQTNSLDPVEAVIEVLKALPGAKRRVTAAVKLDENIGSTDWTKPETTVADIDKPQEELGRWLPKA